MRCKNCGRELNVYNYIKLLKTKINDKTISQIHKEYFINYDYKSVYKALKKMENDGIVNLLKNKNSQGCQVFIKLKEDKK